MPTAIQRNEVTSLFKQKECWRPKYGDRVLVDVCLGQMMDAVEKLQGKVFREIESNLASLLSRG